MEENLGVLTGTVEDVIYKNQDNGYIVFNLNNNGILETVVGVLGDIAEGEKLTLQGEYINTAKYGRQFKAVMCERSLPETEEEICKYLSSGIIKGLGPSLAKKITKLFGIDSLEVIENDPLKLARINGITNDKAMYICKEFRKLCGLKTLTEYLQKFDVSPFYSISVWQKYENSSIAAIKENPYILFDSDIGLDFQKIDFIASKLGFDIADINRIKAGILYVLKENSFAGHTCLPYDTLQKLSCKHLDVGENSFIEAMELLVKEEEAVQVDILEKTYVFLREYYKAESYIAKKLSEMLKLSNPLNKDFSEDINGIEWSDNIKFETLQKAAINGCLGNNLFILTGKPGTGKTTTLNAVIQLCKQKKKSLAIAAPTGRAAKRISELTGESAKTIHRLLEVDFSKDNLLSFKHNELNPLNADAIIIDEMSMVDVLLFEALLRATKPESKLIMVGDSNQLPSVGAGNVLHDLIASKMIPMVELTEIFRQAAESLIITNAHAIVNGEMPELDERKKDFFFMEQEDENDIAKLVISLTKTRLPQSYKLSPIDDIQILCPTRLGPAGTKSLNLGLQLALNPPSRSKKEMRHFDVVFRTGDKVMQIKNDYDVLWKKGGEKGSGIFNGDIGIITDIDIPSNCLTIDFEGRVSVYTSEMLSKIEHAFAITIHKSQGSEYNAVIIPITGYSHQLLYRNLLYTGVTRAKNILILIGTKEIIYEMVINNKKTKRYSMIRPLLFMNYKKREEIR